MLKVGRNPGHDVQQALPERKLDGASTNSLQQERAHLTPVPKHAEGTARGMKANSGLARMSVAGNLPSASATQGNAARPHAGNARPAASTPPKPVPSPPVAISDDAVANDRTAQRSRNQPAATHADGRRESRSRSHRRRIPATPPITTGHKPGIPGKYSTKTSRQE